ncbi:chromate resistance protein ChrB domain-containing protein [Methylomonas sp. 11b]|uniref:chromate resistance protein ChrB domain-containing protein n=1 Tax=Methylomonas sp. 11b TaxID=1168169 RepID=UPI0004BAFF13|nr:chromate resistance protein ChrB domain-containing protein [Methylomonas sp. 11b]
MNKWYLLIISLPTENATARMRIWRSLKASGAAVLRDGVYLMPDRAECLETFKGLAVEVKASGGTALVLKTDEPESESFVVLFDRSEEYASLLADISKLSSDLATDSAPDRLKQARKLRKAFTGLAFIDFFPGEAQQQTESALRQLEWTIARLLSPDEPQPVAGLISKLSINDFQGKTWATRQRPWVDRLASAWLIRRFIDPQAHLLWLPAPTVCPQDAIGFDFDGARFSHSDGQVTFEVLVASFDLATPALKRLGGLVHFLDVGGVQPPEAAGIESVLAGLRDAIQDDDQLLVAASGVFDSLLISFEKGASHS